LIADRIQPDGKTLAVGNNNGSIQLWDVARRQ
jgi:WD40 repeat protein